MAILFNKPVLNYEAMCQEQYKSIVILKGELHNEDDIDIKKIIIDMIDTKYQEILMWCTQGQLDDISIMEKRYLKFLKEKDKFI